MDGHPRNINIIGSAHIRTLTLEGAGGKWAISEQLQYWAGYQAGGSEVSTFGSDSSEALTAFCESSAHDVLKNGERVM